MSADKTPIAETPDWDEAPVTLNVIHKLVEDHPNYRLTSHSCNGNEVMMIQFADSDGEYTSGLAGDFVSMVSEAHNDSDEYRIEEDSE
jgi:hypothetical protein